MDKMANLNTVVKTNQLMEAAIIKVDKARFELKLSLRKSDTQPNPDKVKVRPGNASAAAVVWVIVSDVFFFLWVSLFSSALVRTFAK